MMTRKDFSEIATVLNANAAPLYMVLDFADMLETENRRFDRALFVQVATKNLNAQMSHDARMLDKARRGEA